MTKQEIYNRYNSELDDGVCCTIFFKKNGMLRLMLCTRDIFTSNICLGDSLANKLNYHSERCNFKNNNISVIDLLIGDVRSFNIDRVIRNIYLGECNSTNDFNRYIRAYANIESMFKSVDTIITLDNLDIESKIREIANNINVKDVLEQTEQGYISQENQHTEHTKTYQNTDISKFIPFKELKI